ncbi:hypothetical protein C0J52_00806 [Blattella germanica]|nr:hypothetical protein C0J52_00806 [Blattella germanica]
MTLDIVPFDTPTMFATDAAEAPTRWAPTITTASLGFCQVTHFTTPSAYHDTTAEILTAAGRGRST